MKNIIVLFSITFLNLGFACGQDTYFLNVTCKEHNLKYEKVHPDSLNVILELRNIIKILNEASYLLASVDSVMFDKDSVFAFVNAGMPFKWASLKIGNLPNQIIYKAGFKEKFYNNKPFKYTDYIKVRDEIISQAENYGYPFASVYLDSVSIQDNYIKAAINYSQGPEIIFDSLEIIGNAQIKKSFLQNYLKIVPGQPFSQEKIDLIERSLKELPYLKQTRPKIITFRGNKAKIGLFLEDRKVNQIDGIIGFLPNEANDNKLLITGEVNLNLRNLFNSGKNLRLEWRRFMQSSQLLDMAYVHPRIFGSGFDVEAALNLFKQDTAFINVDRNLVLHHNINKYGRVHFFSGLKTSRILSSSAISNTQTLPTVNDFDYIKYGLGYTWNKLDDFFYPHKGWFFTSSAIIGNKNIRQSAFVNEELYEGVQLNSIQYMLHLQLQKFFSLNEQSVLLVKGESGNIINNAQNIFLNDLFRIGGLRTLRGFNENNFFASDYVIGSVEYRFFTDETSYLLAFIDQGFVRNTFNPNFISDFPRSFGVGVSFASGPGIFNFVYSLGTSRQQPLSLNLSKIHFGYISRF